MGGVHASSFKNEQDSVMRIMSSTIKNVINSHVFSADTDPDMDPGWLCQRIRLFIGMRWLIIATFVVTNFMDVVIFLRDVEAMV